MFTFTRQTQRQKNHRQDATRPATAAILVSIRCKSYGVIYCYDRCFLIVPFQWHLPSPVMPVSIKSNHSLTYIQLQYEHTKTHSTHTYWIEQHILITRKSIPNKSFLDFDMDITTSNVLIVLIMNFNIEMEYFTCVMMNLLEC